jgi:molybdenum cofactor cytidylyltransferase
LDRKVLAVILAAGASKRFGGTKQLAMFNGQTLIEHVQTVLLSSTVYEVAAVLGCEIEKIAPHILAGVTLLSNDEWEEGIASSVRRAARFAVEVGATHLFLFVCDQPFVSSCLVDKVLALSKFNPDSIIACRYGESNGVPALFPGAAYGDLLSLSGDCGAKSIIEKSEKLEIVDFPEGASDVDYLADLSEANLKSEIC